MLQFLVMIFVTTHWSACVWRLIVNFELTGEETIEDAEHTWLYAHLADSVANGEPASGPGDLYVTCLYWAVTTTTTIGYGDAANPQTTLERLVAMGLMLVGCGMWAYVLGAVTAKVAALDVDTARYREDMDALRSFCRVKRLPTEMRLRLKEYFRHRRALLKDVANNRLIEELSPGLRGEVGRSEWRDETNNNA